MQGKIQGNLGDFDAQNQNDVSVWKLQFCFKRYILRIPSVFCYRGNFLPAHPLNHFAYPLNHFAYPWGYAYPSLGTEALEHTIGYFTDHGLVMSCSRSNRFIWPPFGVIATAPVFLSNKHNNDRNDEQTLIKKQNHWENVTSALNSAPATPPFQRLTHRSPLKPHSRARLPNRI